jgi:hypothetical protein
MVQSPVTGESSGRPFGITGLQNSADDKNTAAHYFVNGLGWALFLGLSATRQLEFGLPYLTFLPLVRIEGIDRRRIMAVIGLGEHREEVAYSVAFLSRVPECGVRIDGVHGAPSFPGTGQVTGRLQVGHDGLDRALGEANDGADVPDPGLGVAGDLDEYVPVAGQQCPGSAAVLRITHATDHITRETTITGEVTRFFSHVSIDRCLGVAGGW